MRKFFLIKASNKNVGQNMNREEKINEETGKTLNVFEDVKDLEANPYLFTRFQSEIEGMRSKEREFSLKGSILKPAVLLIVIIVNIYTAFSFSNNENETTSTKQTYLSAISSEYSISHSYYSQLDEMSGK